MKLSFKIFLGICIPAIIVVLIISAIVIDKNHETNVDAERQAAIQNIKDIERNLKSVGEDANIDMINMIQLSYKQKGIYIVYYENGAKKFDNSANGVIQYSDISNVGNDSYTTNVVDVGENSYVYACTEVDNQKYLAVVRDINSVYLTRQELIYNCIYIVIISIVAIAIIAYIISKSLTRPLEKMKNEMNKLSKGDFDIHLKEGHDEFGKLAKNFNKMSKELEVRNNELIESANNKQMFIDNLSHEMNTPLTSIQGYAELMEKANLNDEQKGKYLKYIQDESKRIQDMYKKLLLLSYKKNSDFEKSNVDMNQAFIEIKNTLDERLNTAGVELIINNQLNYIFGDETLIIMCVSNLIKNAINVSDPGTKIMINAFEMNNKKYIQVVDQGPGISKENIQRITEPFYRVDKVRSRKNGGAGLGLAICKSIMEMHEGEMKIESELGKGSMFILEFPA